MAGNIFDQFDQQAQPAAAPAGNVFDQFDQVASLNTTQDAGRFAAPGLPQEMPAGAPPPQQPGRRQAEMRSYEPTWREQIAQYMMGDQRASPEKQRLVGGLMGTTGLPGSEQMGVVDVTPARIPMFAQEAKRSYDEGNYGKAALNAVGATPAPILGKAVEGVVGGASKAINAFRGEPVRQIAGAVDDVAREAPKAARARMSPAELKAASRAAYKEADEAGVIFTPTGVARVSKEVKDAATEFGFDPILHPQFARALERLDEVAAGNVTFKGMDVLRKVAKASASSLKDEERALGMMMIDKIDDLMENSKTFEALTGATDQAADAVRKARDLWGRAKRTELIETAVRNAELRASSTGSGGNVNNAIRQNLRALLTNPKDARKFSEKERAQIEKVVRGTAPLNTLRLIGKLSPEGGALGLVGGMAMSAGAFTVNPLLATIPIGGAIAKRAADSGTNRAVNRLLNDVSSGAKRNALGPR
jgi:hypothetical protein